MIFAFTGKMKSGKTEACKYLELHGYHKVGFKDAMLEEMKQTFPDFLEQIASFYKCTIDDLFKIKPTEIRKFMQNYGTDLRRKDDLEYWTKKWTNESYNYINICVDDCRFLNEAKAVKDRNGIIVRITRDGLPESTHESEKEMDNIVSDFDIDNNGTIKELHDKIDVVLKYYGCI